MRRADRGTGCGSSALRSRLAWRASRRSNARKFSRPPWRKKRNSLSSSSGGSVDCAASRSSSRSSPGSTASAMHRSRASADRRSMPYLHQSRPPSRRTTMTLACAATRSIHRSTDIGWRRSRRWARRTLGKSPRSASQAATRPARSLSANDSTTTSPGVCLRSTASTISSRFVELVVSRCIVSPCRCDFLVGAKRKRPRPKTS
jgi:hypothetical protein